MTAQEAQILAAEKIYGWVNNGKYGSGPKIVQGIDWDSAGDIISRMRDRAFSVMFVGYLDTYVATFVPKGVNTEYEVTNPGHSHGPTMILIAALFAVGAITQIPECFNG